MSSGCARNIPSFSASRRRRPRGSAEPMLRSGRGDDRPGGFPGLKRRDETMTTTDDLDALTNEACNLAMAGVPHDDPRLVDLDRRTLAAWFAQAGMAPMSMAEIYTALTQ